MFGQRNEKECMRERIQQLERERESETIGTTVSKNE